MSQAQDFIDIEVDPSLKLKNIPKANVKVGESIVRQKGVDKFQAYSSNFEESSIRSTGNSFVDAIYYAFTEHIPLELSPQIFWLLILHGLAQHITLNAESLRNKFVDFQGKKTLEMRRDNFRWGNPNNDWATVFEDFTKQIKENIGQRNFDAISSDFSQTSAIEKAVLNLSIMDAMKEYFEFKVTTACGISKVRLRGTLNDWIQLRDKVKGLAQYDFGWWVNTVIPILNQFVEARSGKTNKRFWTSIYKQYSEAGSGAVDRVNGWFQNFFPYVDRNGSFIKNPNLRPLSEILKNFTAKRADDLPRNYIPGGVRQVPFIWSYFGDDKKMKFVSGFSGLKTSKDGFIYPIVAWGIGENKEEPKNPWE